MSEINAELAAFQTFMLNTLYKYETAEEIFYAFSKENACKPFEGWISQLDPAMLEVSAELVKKWGVKKDPN